MTSPAIQASNTNMITASTVHRARVGSDALNCMHGGKDRAGPCTDSRMQTHMHVAMKGWLAAQQVSMERNVRSGGTSVLYSQLWCYCALTCQLTGFTSIPLIPRLYWYQCRYLSIADLSVSVGIEMDNNLIPNTMAWNEYMMQ